MILRENVSNLRGFVANPNDTLLWHRSGIPHMILERAVSTLKEG